MARVKVFGAGSIGNHLAHACRSLGWAVTLCDVDPQALRRTREEIYPARYGAWDDGIRLAAVDGDRFDHFLALEGDPGAVGGPSGALGSAAVGEALQVAAVGAHGVEVPAGLAVGEEGDASAIGRPGGGHAVVGVEELHGSSVVRRYSAGRSMSSMSMPKASRGWMKPILLP